MPDLSLRASHEYWKAFNDPMIYRVVSFMESVENWTLDGDIQLEAAMEKFGNILEDVTNFNLDKEMNYIQVGCYLKMNRTLRLLQAIDSTHPGSASRILMHAEENSESSEDPAGVFLRRNIVFERLRLLARIFAPERFDLIRKAIEAEDEE